MQSCIASYIYAAPPLHGEPPPNSEQLYGDPGVGAPGSGPTAGLFIVGGTPETRNGETWGTVRSSYGANLTADNFTITGQAGSPGAYYTPVSVYEGNARATFTNTTIYAAQQASLAIVTASTTGYLKLGSGVLVTQQPSFPSTATVAGVAAFGGGIIDADGINIYLPYGRAFAVQASNTAPGGGLPSSNAQGTVNLSNSNVTVGNGSGSNYSYASWVRGQAVANFTNVNLTSGNQSVGAYVFVIAADTGITTGAAANWNNVALTTGNQSVGIWASGNPVSVTANNSRLNLGSDSWGAYVAGGAVVKLTDTDITTGTNSEGISIAGGSTVNMTRGNLTVSGTSTAIDLSTQNIGTSAVFDGARVSSEALAIKSTNSITSVSLQNGTSVSGPTLVSALTNSQLSLLANQNVTLNGNILADGSSQVNLAMSNSSTWTGATPKGNNFQFASASRWNMTDSSVVSSLANSASQINFSAPSGGVFKTLTTNSYVGAGGTISLHTQLGTDVSPSDKLIINGGTASGNSFLRIANAGGTGAETTGSGILVVEAINGGTTAANAFALGAPAVAGIYDYGLFRGSGNAIAPDNWYLRSTRVRPETSLYAVLPVLGILYGGKLIDTLDERWGEDTQWMGGGATGLSSGDSMNELGSKNYPDGMWGRVIGQHGKRDGQANNVFGVGPSYNHDFYAMQAGMDLYRSKDSNGHQHAGVYGAIGYGKGNVTHFDGTAAGRNSFNAYTIGGYWTHFGPTNWYIDSVVQATWYDAKGDSRRGLSELKTQGMGYTLSLEGGYPFHLQNDWLIEPQAQVIYSKLDLDDTNDAGGSVSFRDGHSMIGRLGVRIGRSRTKEKNAELRDSTGWVRLSVLREFSGQPKVDFTGPNGSVSFPADMGGNWGEIKGGLTKQLSRGKFLYGTLGYQRAFDGNSYAYEAKLGLRVEW
ncbi:autotransporter outer membrane beta-barrel domain-containing protein [Herminiimonas glaciei]|uniref:Autotransporter outer membrane beta-barrel domain-containing protein n=1 Tax=Herminiimonas glaciei TaxID=523788 RepID=A0ABW2IBC5_9BURK